MTECSSSSVVGQLSQGEVTAGGTTDGVLHPKSSFRISNTFGPKAVRSDRQSWYVSLSPSPDFAKNFNFTFRVKLQPPRMFDNNSEDPEAFGGA